MLALAGGMTVLAMRGAFAAAHEGHEHDAASTPAATPASSPMAAPMVGADLSTGAAYLTIRNDGDGADRLTGATTPMAQAVEIHETRDENGVGTMRMQEDGVEIPPGETVAFAPGGYHLMLVGLTESLLPDMTYELTLTFAHAGAVTITVAVRRDAPEGDDASETVTVGDLTIQNAWSRPAPKLDVGGVASPEASPEHDHSH
jgi:hypothetical protein